MKLQKYKLLIKCDMSKNWKLVAFALFFGLSQGFIISLVQVESGPGFYERLLWYFVSRSPIFLAEALSCLLALMYLTRKPKSPE